MRAASKALVRVAILDAAEACFAEEGLSKARMGAVARRAGVAVGTLYNYFGRRDELVRAVLDRRNRELDERLTRSLAPPAHFEAAIRTLVTEVFDHCAEHAAFYSLLLQGETAVRRPPGHGPGMRVVLRHVSRLSERAGAEEVVTPCNGALHTELVVGCIRGGILHALEHGAEPARWRTLAAEVTQFVLAGVHGREREASGSDETHTA